MDGDRRLNVSFQKDIDLEGKWLSADEKCIYKKGFKKCSIKGKVSIENTGSHASKSSVVLFFLSDDSMPDHGDTMIKKTRSGVVKAAGAGTKALSHRLPQGETAAGRYLIAVIDAEGMVEETDEMNNTAVFGPIPVDQ